MESNYSSLKHCHICEYSGDHTMKAILSAAEQGCQHCSTISAGILKFAKDPEAISKVSDERILYGRPGRYELFYSSVTFPRTIEFFSSRRETSPGARFLENISNETCNQCSALETRGDPADDFASDEGITLALHWIKNCTGTHRQCPRRIATQLPKRVIHVGSDTEAPRLLVTDNTKAEYAVLSHCWGGTTALRTTQANIKQHERSLPFEELPKTFRDAVRLTRRLNIKYLWIDSLCIIQDDEEDWVDQSSVMGRIYRESFICIAAHAAADSNAGFLDQKRKKIDVFQIQSLDSSHQLSVRYAGKSVDGFDGLHACSGSNSPAQISKLLTRGWAYQELILAPRTLHFTDVEVFFTCARGQYCECGPEGLHESSKGIIHSALYASISTSSMAEKLKLLEKDNYWWGVIVEEFSVRDLTFTTDRLPAISGLASAVQQFEMDQYLCGLWRRKIVDGLSWMRSIAKSWSEFRSSWCTAGWRKLPQLFDHSTRLSGRHDKYYAPTWSWASITGPVSYLDTTFPFSSDVVILGASIEPSGPDPLGPARSGFIRLKAKIKETTLEVHQKISEDTHVIRAPFEGRYTPEVFTDVTKYESEIFLDDPHYLLFLSSQPPSDPYFPFDPMGLCLVLKRSKRQTDAYERVGITMLDLEDYMVASRTAVAQTIELI